MQFTAKVGSTEHRLVIARATVLTGNGRDRVSLVTNYPPTGADDDCLYLEFLTPKGQGELYVTKHFPDVEIKVIKR